MWKKNLLKFSLLAALIFSLFIPGFSKDKTFNSVWSSTQLMIDGAPLEWTEATLNNEKKVKVDYSFKNDGDYLYVLFRFNDPKYVSTLDMTGLTVYHNAEGKKKKDYGTVFKAQRVEAGAYIAFLEKSGRQLTDEDKTQIKAQKFILLNDNTVINKKVKKPEEFDNTGVKPAIFRGNKSKENYILELAIPLAKPADMAPGIGTEPGKAIKIGFEWGGMTEEMRKQRLSQATARSSNARAGNMSSNPMSEGRAGGASGSISSIRRYAPKKYSFWVDVKLAGNQ